MQKSDISAKVRQSCSSDPFSLQSKQLQPDYVSSYLGFIFIRIGYFTKQKFARNAKFRICHILVMGIVLCESLIGMICPSQGFMRKMG